MDYDDDFGDDDMNDDETTSEGTSAEGRPIVRHVVKDVQSAMKLRQITETAKAKSEMAQIKADERRRKQELKAELARMRMQMSAGEKARAHIAFAGPFYLLVLISGFIGLLSTGKIPDEQVSVASALLTLLITSFAANLRSIVASEGGTRDDEPTNGHDEEPEEKAKATPKSYL